MTVKHIVIVLEGLSHGGGGTLMIERQLQKVPGVVRVHANPATEMAYIDYDPTHVTPDDLAAAVERCGIHAGKVSAR